MVKSVIYLLFSYQTGYIMWHSRLRIYIPLGADIYIADLTEGAKWFVITLIKIVLQYVILYYRFSLLHIFALVLQPWMSAYSENRKGIYFSPQKRFKHGRENITLHWINCIIYRIINVFLPNYMLFLYSKRLHEHTQLQRLIPSQIPDRFSKLLRSTAVP